MPRRRNRPTLAVTTKQTPSWDLALQEYVQLSNQKDNLQHRLTSSTSCSTVSPFSAASPTDPFSLSPVASHDSPLQPLTYHTSISSSSGSSYLSASHPTVPMPYAAALASTTSSPSDGGHDEERLADVNHQIKATLTELLNHESTRHDEGFRHWVQERLMEAELETRKHRRRSRRRSSIDREAVSNSIAENMRGPDMYRFGTTV